MKSLEHIWKNFLGLDRRARLSWGIGLVVFLLLVILLSTMNNRIAFLTKKCTLRQAELREVLFLKERYQEASVRTQKLVNRLSGLRPDDSPARIIEEVGIKGKGSQIKPMKGEEYRGYIEDGAEIRLEGLSVNETINLFYGLEKGNKPILIKKVLMKSRFDDPTKLDLTLTLALLKPAPPGQR